MNQFRTITFSFLIGVFCFTSLVGQTTTPSKPSYTLGSFIYADIDTASQKLYILLSDGLWQYDITNESWSFLMGNEGLPTPITDFDLAFDSNSNCIFLWYRGIGRVYEIDLDLLSIKRIDKSFDHKNQFGHFPFLRNGNIHAFGGYGFWQYKDYITFYNSEISEWNIVTVSQESAHPPKLAPENGFYMSKTDELFIYGGERIENNRYDDHAATKTLSNDIWKYSFQSSSWDLIGSILSDGITPYRSSLDARFGTTNSASISMFSPTSGIWYLPVKIENRANEIYYLSPFNTNTGSEAQPIEIQLGASKSFLITNYLFNPKTQSAVFIGIDNQTNASSFPMQIKTIPESMFLNNLSFYSNLSISRASIYLIVSGAILLLGFLFVRLRINGLATNKKHFTKEDLLNHESLTDLERNLLHTLYQQNEAIDSQQLEELIWGDIENYDYRRKLKNETINSINQKLSKLTGLTSEFIKRHKDPNDNRRYLYRIEFFNQT